MVFSLLPLGVNIHLPGISNRSLGKFDFRLDPKITAALSGDSVDCWASAERVVVRPARLGSNLLMVGAAELPFEMLMRDPAGYILASLG